MVSCTEKIVSNGYSANFLNKVNQINNAEDEKLNKTITDFSESEEINISRENFDLSKINEKKKKDNQLELIVFDEETKMQIDKNSSLSNDNNLLNENNLFQNKPINHNFKVIRNTFNINNIDNSNQSKLGKLSSNNLEKSSNKELKNDNNFKADKNSRNINKNKPFVCIGSQDVTANLTENNANNLSSKKFNIFQTYNFNKSNQHSFLNDNISEKINLKEDNFSSFTEKKESLLEQEEKEILQNFVQKKQKKKKRTFNLEFIPSDESSILDNYNSDSNCTINSNLEENDNEENSSKTEKSDNSPRKKRLDSDYKAGRWTNEEHVSFLEAIFLYNNNWRKVQQHIKTRSSTQARSHAQKFFISLKKKIFEEIENPSENTFNQEKFINYLGEAVEDLFIKKIYGKSLIIRDEIFNERRDKLLSLIIALLSSNTKNKNSFFKCIGSKELAKPRKNSLKRSIIKNISETLSYKNLNIEENNFENSFNIKPSLSHTSSSEAKLDNNDISNITRNNSNMNMNFSLDPLSIRKNNLNGDCTSTINPNNNLKNIVSKYSDNNLFFRNFNDKKLEDNDKTSNLFSNYYNKIPENFNSNVNFFSQNITNKFKSKINPPSERNNINLNLEDKTLMDQTLQLSKTYFKKELINNSKNNLNHQNLNNDQDTNSIFKKDLKIHNNHIVENLANNYIQNYHIKKDEANDSGNIIDLKIKKNNINNAIVNLGSHSFSSKDINQDLCLNNFDPMLKYNIENFNKIRRSSITSVNSRFKNDNLLGKKHTIDKEFSIQNLYNIENEENKYVTKLKEKDLMENSISDLAEDSLSESDLFKNINQHSSHKTKLSFGNSKSFINHNYNLEFENEKNQKENNILMNKPQEEFNKNFQIVNDSVSSKNFKKLINNIRKQPNLNNLQINYNVYENCNKNTNQNIQTNYEGINKNNQNTESFQIPYNNDNKKNDLVYQKRIETKDINSLINNSYSKANPVEYEAKSQNKILMNKISHNIPNEDGFNENKINRIGKSLINDRKLFKVSEYQNTFNNNIKKFNENPQNKINRKKNIEMCDPNKVENSTINSNDKNFLSKIIHQNENKKNLILMNLNNQINNDFNTNSNMLKNSNNQNKNDIGKKKFQCLKIDLIQDLSGELKNIEENSIMNSLSFNSNKNEGNLYPTNYLDKSRFLQTFNNSIKNTTKEGYEENNNTSLYFKDKGTLNPREIPIANQILYKNQLKFYKNEDFSQNKILKNIEILNNETNKNFQDYFNNCQKQPVNETEVISNNISFNLSSKKDFKSNQQKSNLHNPPSFNNGFTQNNTLFDKIVHENNTNSIDCVKDSLNKQNTYTNLNHNNYINIVNINVLPSKESNISQLYSTDIYENQENKNDNKVNKKASTNDKFTVENKFPDTLLNQQIKDVLNTNLKNSDISSATMKTFKVPNQENSLNNFTINNHTKSIFDDHIINNICNNNSIKEKYSNNYSHADLFNNLNSSKKQETKSNINKLSSEELLKDNNNSNFVRNQTSIKEFIEGNDLISKINNRSNENTKGLNKESKEETLNPFNINFNVEEEKGLIGNNKNIIFASYMNNPKEEDEFLGFYLLPN